MCSQYVPGRIMEVRDLMKGLANIRINEDIVFNQTVYPRGEGPFFVSAESEDLEMEIGEFSIIPKWFDPDKHKSTKKRRPSFPTYNARSETILEKPSFRDAFKTSRCLIPITSFNESSHFGDLYSGNMITLKSENDGVLIAGGIYSNWTDRSTGEIVTSYSILTTEPPADVLEAGHDRCPLFLKPKSALEYLNSKDQPKQILEFVRGKFSPPKFSFKVLRALKGS